MNTQPQQVHLPHHGVRLDNGRAISATEALEWRGEEKDHQYKIYSHDSFVWVDSLSVEILG